MFNQQELDLIKNTQKSLKEHKGEYTVGILYNWMKIFFITKSKLLDRLPIQTIDPNIWGIAPKDIWICKTYYKDGATHRTVSNDHSVRTVAAHLWVSVIHHWITYLRASEAENVIKLNFYFRGIERVKFRLEVSVENFRVFLLKLCETIT